MSHSSSMSYSSSNQLPCHIPAAMVIIFTLSVFSLASFASAGSCPPADDLAPLCNCQTYGGDYLMDCHNVDCPDDLIAPLRSLAQHHSKIYSLQLDSSILMYLPGNVFEGTFIEMIQFYRTEIMSLSDTDVAFSGLEDILLEIRATEAEYIASWDWQQLRNLRALQLIDVNQIVMGAVDVPFPHLQNLTSLGISNAGVTYVVEGAFANLTALEILNLENNEITELKRNMLPDNLVILDLRNNLINHLPDDFFSNMTNIKAVHLDNNKFLTLSEHPFRMAFLNLNELSLTDNPLRCDCRMRWLVDLRAPFQFIAACTKPEFLKEHSITSLEMKQLYC